MLLYRNREEQFAAIVPYIEEGLARNERCLYIAGDNPIRLVIEALEHGGIDVLGTEKSGQLTIASYRETYLNGGVFEPAQVADGLTEEIAKSLRNGFCGMRGSGEMGWAASRSDALLHLYEYEALIEERMNQYFTALCQYNENVFDGELISRMFRIHPTVFARGSVFDNRFYVGPQKFLLDGLPSLTLENVIAGAI